MTTTSPCSRRPSAQRRSPVRRASDRSANCCGPERHSTCPTGRGRSRGDGNATEHRRAGTRLLTCPPPSTLERHSVLAIGPGLHTAGAERAWGKHEGDQPLGPPPALRGRQAQHTRLTRTARGERPRPGHGQLSRRGSSAPGAAAGIRPGKRGTRRRRKLPGGGGGGAAAGQSAQETRRWGRATATRPLRKMRRDPYLLHS